MNYKEILEELKWNSCSYAEEDCYNCKVEDKQACSNMRILCKQAADAIEQLVRERDAAVKDIGWNCIKCKHYDEASPNYGYTEECENCGTYPWFDDEAESNWEWRGVQE